MPPVCVTPPSTSEPSSQTCAGYGAQLSSRVSTHEDTDGRDTRIPTNSTTATMAESQVRIPKTMGQNLDAETQCMLAPTFKHQLLQAVVQTGCQNSFGTFCLFHKFTDAYWVAWHAKLLSNGRLHVDKQNVTFEKLVPKMIAHYLAASSATPTKHEMPASPTSIITSIEAPIGDASASAQITIVQCAMPSDAKTAVPNFNDNTAQIKLADDTYGSVQLTIGNAHGKNTTLAPAFSGSQTGEHKALVAPDVVSSIPMPHAAEHATRADPNAHDALLREAALPLDTGPDRCKFFHHLNNVLHQMHFQWVFGIRISSLSVRRNSVLRSRPPSAQERADLCWEISVPGEYGIPKDTERQVCAIGHVANKDPASTSVTMTGFDRECDREPRNIREYYYRAARTNEFIHMRKKEEKHEVLPRQLKNRMLRELHLRRESWRDFWAFRKEVRALRLA